ncbi:MAG: hypothetical protein GDA37_12700 [Ekhidna sp.]|nr:hypothetical protein [Ekhidna sp.]
MPFYPNLKFKKNDPERIKKERGVANIKVLRKAMNRHFENSQKQQTLYSTIKIATWNLREFGSTKYKGRSFEELYYIAERITFINCSIN